ncbi:MAG: hypothetical protein JO253_03085 [Alphaproteobacteria bacterium]|nr:hypothetical protein [Alphaproteobacteria bacterium]
MTPGEKLKAISRLKMADGLNYADYYDIGIWWERSDKGQDTTLLSDLARERIDSIFRQFFTPDGA